MIASRSSALQPLQRTLVALNSLPADRLFER